MIKKWKEVIIISLLILMMPLAAFSHDMPTVNNPPNKPSRPIGPTFGEVGVYYYYTSRATDPDGDRIHYLFDWGDGSSCGTILYESGENCTLPHCWDDYGFYEIKVMAIDEHCACSEWSEPLVVAMPREKLIWNLNILNKWFSSMFGSKIIIPLHNAGQY